MLASIKKIIIDLVTMINELFCIKAATKKQLFIKGKKNGMAN